MLRLISGKRIGQGVLASAHCSMAITTVLPRHYLGVMFSGNRGEGGVVGVAVSRVICICGFVVGVILAHRKEAAQISLTPDTLTP